MAKKMIKVNNYQTAYPKYIPKPKEEKKAAAPKQPYRTNPHAIYD